MISVSVAMATYNGQRHIRRQLDSLAAQSHLPAELVISDDCSDDETIATIAAFAKTAPFPVRIHQNQKRLGYRANFMQVANLCQSELISFCDQDDYWYPHKIGMAVAPFSDPEVLLTYHNADVVTEDGRQIGLLSARALPTSSPWLSVLGFTEVFRRSLLQLSDLWADSLDSLKGDQRLAHDQWVFFLATIFGRTVYLDEPLVAYVQHGRNTVGWRTLRFRDMVRNRADEIARFARAAKSRAAILEAAKSNLDGIWGERAAVAIGYYNKLSCLCAMRSKLYTAASVGDRLRAFRAVIGKSGYAGVWGLGRRTFIVDMCLGVPIGPRLPSISDPDDE
jgi:glycosyltransferase involved in cell wall biosynthesis